MLNNTIYDVQSTYETDRSAFVIWGTNYIRPHELWVCSFESNVKLRRRCVFCSVLVLDMRVEALRVYNLRPKIPTDII
jgi:hypothetical protein